MPENGTLTNITASLTATGAHRAVAILYDDSGNLLTSSTVRTDIGGSLSDEVFTGLSAYSLVSGVVYHAAVLADSGNVADCEYGTGLTYDGYGDAAGTLDADAPPNPATLVVDGGARDYGVWITYTPASGGYSLAWIRA